MERDARVKAVVANHMEASFRETALVLQHVVQVLQMKKGRGNRSASRHWTIDDQGCKWKGVWCSSHLSHPTMGGSVISRKCGNPSTHLIMPPTQQNVV